MFVYKPGDILQSLQTLSIGTYLLVFVAGAVLLTHPLMLIALFLPLIPALAAAEGLEQWRKSMKYFLVMIVLYIIINTMVNKMGATVLFSSPVIPYWGRFTVTWEGSFMGW